VARYLSQIVNCAALVLALCGCSRLSGDHDAETNDEEAARMERLLDDMPESLTENREKSGAAKSSKSELTVASDVRQAAAPATNTATFQPQTMPAATTQPTLRPTADRRPSTARRLKKAPRSVKQADDIPDAADIGL
jgi:hypothetical protein